MSEADERFAAVPWLVIVTTASDIAAPDEYGDGFLLNRGYTIVQVGWEFDARREGAIRAEIPTAIGITGLARATFIPTSTAPEATVGDLVGYTPSDPAASQNTLTVRDSPQAPATTIARAKWRLAGNVVTLDGGFEPGRIYELAYTAANPPVAALGFANVTSPGPLILVQATLRGAPGQPSSATVAVTVVWLLRLSV